MRSFVALLALVVTAMVALLSVVSCGDPTHDDAVAALGDTGEKNGPEHRPGQPCLVCHGGSGPASSEFSVAGTVYEVKGSDNGLEGASVIFSDTTGNDVQTATTNAAGNFYIGKGTWQPSAPYLVRVTLDPNTATMNTHIGRDGSCASCHTDPPGPRSAGRVYLVADLADLDAGRSQ